MCVLLLEIKNHKNDMKLTKSQKNKIWEKIGLPIWSYKIGDNVEYNLEILYKLGNSNKTGVYNKMIIIQIASIVEVLMNDFVERCISATNQFSTAFDKSTQLKLKKILKRDEYSFAKLINIFKAHNFLGKDQEIYKNLQLISDLRDRVHIYNWRQKFKKDESEVFTNENTEKVYSIFMSYIEYMALHHFRPDHKNNLSKK